MDALRAIHGLRHAQIRGETPKIEMDWLARAKHNGTAICTLVRDHWTGLSEERRLTALAATAGALLVTLLLAVLPFLARAPVAVPERKTFYGAREFGVREPGGNHVLFAEFQR